MTVRRNAILFVSTFRWPVESVVTYEASSKLPTIHDQLCFSVSRPLPRGPGAWQLRNTFTFLCQPLSSTHTQCASHAQKLHRYCSTSRSLSLRLMFSFALSLSVCLLVDSLYVKAPTKHATTDMGSIALYCAVANPLFPIKLLRILLVFF